MLSCVLLLACAASGRAANLYYAVYLNTALLTGNTHAPFPLDVVLGSGARTPNPDNTMTLSNSVFSNGGVGATTLSSGGETGSMSSTVTLTTSATDNELAQQFSSTATGIRFSVSMNNVSDNPFVDRFEVSILDRGLNNIPTTDPSGDGTLHRRPEQRRRRGLRPPQRAADERHLHWYGSLGGCTATRGALNKIT